MKSYKQFVLVCISSMFLLMSLLLGCSSGSDEPASTEPEMENTDPVNENDADVRLAVASILIDNNNGAGLEATFRILEPGNSVGPLGMVFNPMRDVCFVRMESLEVGGAGLASLGIDRFALGSVLEFGDGIPNFVSAGDSIVFSSNTVGTLANVPKLTEGEDIVFYGLEDIELSSLPAADQGNLTLDVPGGEFPAITAQSLPLIDALERISPLPGEVVTRDTVYSWTAGTNPDAVMVISAEFENSGAGDNFEIAAVDCIAADDGQFSFPANVLSSISADFQSNRSGFHRRYDEFFDLGENTFLYWSTLAQ